MSDVQQRIDEIEGAQQAVKPVPARGPQPPTRPGVPLPPPMQPVPHYNLWLARVQVVMTINLSL